MFRFQFLPKCDFNDVFNSMFTPCVIYRFASCFISCLALFSCGYRNEFNLDIVNPKMFYASNHFSTSESVKNDSDMMSVGHSRSQVVKRDLELRDLNMPQAFAARDTLHSRTQLAINHATPRWERCRWNKPEPLLNK